MSFGPPEEPDDLPDPLERKPMGFCPWCDRALRYAKELHGYDYYTRCHPYCGEWDEDESEEQNRIRYAAEKIESAQIGERITRESRKYGAGREL